MVSLAQQSAALPTESPSPIARTNEEGPLNEELQGGCDLVAIDEDGIEHVFDHDVHIEDSVNNNTTNHDVSTDTLGLPEITPEDVEKIVSELMGNNSMENHDAHSLTYNAPPQNLLLSPPFHNGQYLPHFQMPHSAPAGPSSA